MSTIEIEKRLLAVERRRARLASTANASSPEDINGWIDQIHGTFQNDATYCQAAHLGRQWRKSQRVAVTLSLSTKTDCYADIAASVAHQARNFGCRLTGPYARPPAIKQKTPHLS